jgi:Bacterial mobilisation protein (MobC)
MQENDERTQRKAHARGSEQRQKQCRVTTRLTWQEHAQFAANAAKAGLTIPSYIREVGIGERQTRSRVRRTVDAEASMKLVAAMNRIGNNLNQLARQANSGEQPVIGAALARLLEACDAVLAVYGGEP